MSSQPYQRRLDESMTLLREVMERPLDPGYAAAAERRKVSGDAPVTGRRRVLSTGLTAVLAVAAGFGLVVAVGVVRQPADSAAKAREQLQERIQQTEATLHDGEARNVRLRSDIATAQQVALGSAGSSLRAEERRLGGITGSLAVSGPGVQITVDDAPSTDDGDGAGDPRAGGAQDAGTVLDIDLQNVVNGLWAAGAEAIAINGQRLTALSAIRSAGQAILVDFRPMVPPYRVQAIGDPATLQTNFATSSAGSYAQMLQQSNIEVSIDGQDRLVLPAAGQLSVRLATPAPHQDEGKLPVIAGLGLLIGIAAGLLLSPTVPLWLQPYLPIAVVAALDAVFGGLRALLDGIFDDRVFVVSFLSNVVVAALIVYLGDHLGVGAQLSTGVVVVLGIRIFSNAAAIRRHLFKA